MRMPSIYIQNIWIMLIVLLPNLLFVFFQPVDINIDNSRPAWWGAIKIAERLGQITVFTLPLFYRLSIDTNAKKTALVIMILTMLVYYFCWGRYLFMGRHYSLLFSKLWIIPLPMAVMPIIYFFAVGILLDSNLILIAAAILSLGHIPESYISNSKIK